MLLLDANRVKIGVANYTAAGYRFHRRLLGGHERKPFVDVRSAKMFKRMVCPSINNASSASMPGQVVLTFFQAEGVARFSPHHGNARHC